MSMGQILFGLNGRIGRGTFWLLMIAVLLLDLAVVALVSDWVHAAYLDAGSPHRPGGGVVGAGFGLLVVAVISVWSFLALKVKRAHDLGHSGWWLFIGLIPVYGVVRLIYELGFMPGSSRRNNYGEAPGFIGDDEAMPAERPALAVWTASQPPETPFAEPLPRLEPPPPDPPVDGPIHAAEPAQTLERPAEPAEDAVPDPALAEARNGDDEPVEPNLEPEPAPILVHPIMDWGKTYQPDLNWPEFQASEPGLNLLPAAEPDSPEPLPSSVPPLAWTPAPAHEAYAELGPLTPAPANDLHERL